MAKSSPDPIRDTPNARKLRKTSVLLRITNQDGHPLDADSVKIELVLVSSDKRKLFDHLQADRSLIALEYQHHLNEAPAAAPQLHEAAE